MNIPHFKMNIFYIKPKRIVHCYYVVDSFSITFTNRHFTKDFNILECLFILGFNKTVTHGKIRICIKLNFALCLHCHHNLNVQPVKINIIITSNHNQNVIFWWPIVANVVIGVRLHFYPPVLKHPFRKC